MKRSKLFLLIVVLVIGIPVVTVCVLLATLDVNSYRPEIGAVLSERIGRNVTLAGPMHLGFSLPGGIDLSVKDVSIATPPGSRPPVTAKIGHLALAVAFFPLLHHELDITSMDASDVNIHLNNMAASPAIGAAGTPTSKPAANKGKPLVFNVHKVSIKNVNLAIQGRNGKTATYKISTLTLNTIGSKMQLAANGSVNGAPLGLDVEGPRGLERLRKAPWPFTGRARYAGLDMKTNGTMDVQGQKIVLDDMMLTAGATKVTGKLAIAYGGMLPYVHGTISSDNLNPKDFERAFSEKAKAQKVSSSKTEEKAGPAGGKSISSRRPGPPFGLQAVDAHLDVAIGHLHVGRASFNQVHATMDLSDGRLLLAPVNALLAGGTINGRIGLDARKSPIQTGMVFNARRVDLVQLARLAGVHSFLKGKGDIDLDIASEGLSRHDLLSHSRGRIALVMGRGNLRAGELAHMATSLLNTLIPGAVGTTQTRVNCLAARFNVAGGRMRSNGILMDTGAATVMGTGKIDLRDKTIDMLLNSRPKIANIGAFTPALRISGPLANPRYSVATGSYLQKLKGLLQGQNAESNVPALIQRAGQNACVATLDHPQGARGRAPASGGIQGILNKAGSSIGSFGSKILHGIGGAFGK